MEKDIDKMTNTEFLLTHGVYAKEIERYKRMYCVEQQEAAAARKAMNDPKREPQFYSTCTVADLVEKQPDPTAKFREAAESCSVKGITIHFLDNHTICESYIAAVVNQGGMTELILRVEADVNPEQWLDQTLQLRAKANRLRELLRQAGEAI